MVVRLAMALASISWAHVVNFLLAGNLIGDLAAVPSHGAEEDVTLMHMKGARSKVPLPGHFR